MNLVHHILTLLRAGGADAQHIAQLGVHRHIFIVVGLIYKKTGNTQFVKKYAGLFIQNPGDGLCQLSFHRICLSAQTTGCAFGASAYVFDLLLCGFQLVDIMLPGQTDQLKGAVGHNNTVVVIVTDAFQHRFPLFGCKVFGLYAQKIGMGVQPQEHIPPLSHQIVGYHIKIFCGHTHAPHFHTGGDHHKGFTGAYIMGQQGVGGEKDPCHRILLIWVQGNIR